MKPGSLFREVVAGAVFLAAAGNLFVYTVKSFRATYSAPPLKAWQGGGGLLTGPQGENGNGKGKGKGKDESLPEELLGAGGTLLKGIIPGLP